MVDEKVLPPAVRKVAWWAREKAGERVATWVERMVAERDAERGVAWAD